MRFVALKSEAQQARAKPRPAMVWLQTMRGLLHDRIRSHTQTVQKSLAPTGHPYMHKSRPEDSPHESSVIAGGYEQLDPYEIQDPELGRV